MQNPRGEFVNSSSPKRGGIVEQLRHDTSGIRVPRVLYLDDAELSTLVDKHEICVPGSQRRLATDHYARPHPNIRKRDKLRIVCQSVMKFSLGRQLGLNYDVTDLVPLTDQDVPGHLDTILVDHRALAMPTCPTAPSAYFDYRRRHQRTVCAPSSFAQLSWLCANPGSRPACQMRQG